MTTEIDTGPIAEVSTRLADAVSAVDVFGEHGRGLSVEERIRTLRRWRKLIVEHQDEIAQDIARETGKPVLEAMQQEVVAALGMLRFLEREYPRHLRSRKFRYPVPGYFSRRFELTFDPIGVIAVISPGNFPFSLAVMQAGSVLMCGNGIILKPSERCPNVGVWLERILVAKDCPIRVLQGGSEVAESLIRHPRIDKVLFTGRRESGLEVARICGAEAKPCILEMGGNGTALVLPDADMVNTAKALVWSSGYSVGQSCIGTRRVLLLPGAREPFEQAWKRAVKDLKMGDELNADTDLVSDAGLNNVEFLDVRNLDEALVQVNDYGDGLSASVWTANKNAGLQIARQIRTGMVWINDASVAMPRFPWGGTRKGGWGRLYAVETIPELTNMKVIAKGNIARSAFWRFPYSRRKSDRTRWLSRFVLRRW